MERSAKHFFAKGRDPGRWCDIVVFADEEFCRGCQQFFRGLKAWEIKGRCQKDELADPVGISDGKAGRHQAAKA